MTQTCKKCGKTDGEFVFKTRCLDCHRIICRARAAQMRDNRRARGLTTRGTIPLAPAVIREKNRNGAILGRDAVINYAANQRRWAEAAAGVKFGGR